MKKIVPLFVATILLVIISCGDSKKDPIPEKDPDTPSISETRVLPVKIIMNSGGDTRAYTITYLDNTAKINNITSTDHHLETYLYQGELISKKYEGAIGSDRYESYSYANDKLIKQESYRGGGNTDKVDFSYSGTKAQVTFKEFNNNSWEETFQAYFNYNSVGNLVNAEMMMQGAPAGTVTISYDDKYAPFMNVLGWGKIRYTSSAPLGDNIGFEDILGFRNNPIKLKGTIEAFGGNIEVDYVYEFKDSKNPKFPTKITGTKKVGTTVETFTAEITYK